MDPQLTHSTYAVMIRFLHRVAQEGAAELVGFGLTPAQYQALMSVGSRPGVAQWELAETFGVTKGNVSQLVKKLEASGWVLRARVQGSDEIRLTDLGRDLLARVVPAHDAFMIRQFASLSPEELSSLHGYVERLAGK